MSARSSCLPHGAGPRCGPPRCAAVERPLGTQGSAAGTAAWPLEILQRVTTEIEKPDAEVTVGQQVPCRLRGDDLGWVRRRADPRCAVDVQADVIVRDHAGRSGVDAQRHWRHAPSGHASLVSSRWASPAASTASFGLENAAKTASPSNPKMTPRRNASPTSVRCRSSRSEYVCSFARRRRVEPSISVNTSVTVPVGSEGPVPGATIARSYAAGSCVARRRTPGFPGLRESSPARR